MAVAAATCHNMIRFGVDFVWERFGNCHFDLRLSTVQAKQWKEFLSLTFDSSSLHDLSYYLFAKFSEKIFVNLFNNISNLSPNKITARIYI